MALYYINGTSNSGTTFGQSGYFYPLYLTATEANAAVDNNLGTSHAHTFEEVPNVTFWMPIEDAIHASPTAPSGIYSGEFYVSYLSPISEDDVEEIGNGVLSSDTFNSWRKKTNDIGREALSNKAIANAVDTRLNLLLNVTGGNDNIVTLTHNQGITGEKTFEGAVKLTGAVNATNALQIGSTGKLYLSGDSIKVNKDIDLSESGSTVKASKLNIPSGLTEYAGVTYTWPSASPQPGQILKASTGGSLQWQTEATAEAQVEAYQIEDPTPVGTITQWSTDSIPNKWLLCDGRAVNRATYSSLFNVIGTTYGGGDAMTTFNLPDLRARVPVGKGTNSDSQISAAFTTLGGTTYTANSLSFGGEYKHKLTVAEIPAHNHTINNMNPRNVYDRDQGGGGYDPNTEGSILTDLTGGDEAHNNVQPFITLNYIIKYEETATVTQNVTPGQGLLINNARAASNLLEANSVNTLELDVDASDFEFNGAGQLKLKDAAIHELLDAKIKTVTIETPIGVPDITHSIEHNLGGMPAMFQMFVKFKTANPTFYAEVGDMIPIFNGQIWSSNAGFFGQRASATKFYWGYGASTYNGFWLATAGTGGGVVLTPNDTDHALVISATRYV